MNNKDITKKDEKALVELVKEKRDALRHFRFSNTGGATRNVRQARTDKKVVARALTELTARAKSSTKDNG